MSWRLKVRHATGYRYDTEVASSYNEARLTPQTLGEQLTLESTMTISPPVRTQRYWDYWGTQVTAFDLHVPHTELEVTATSVVDTEDAVAAPTSTAWDVLRSEQAKDEFVELLVSTEQTEPDPELFGLARDTAAGKTPHEAAHALLLHVHEQVAYVPKSTGVTTSAQEAWALRKGVCQDIVHVSLALLRAAGIPARYVSGYLHPDQDAALGVTVAGESHAWVEAWLGGWWAFDPTNAVPVGERHVIVARGRDYTDVVPLKGVYAGGGSQSLGVSVEVTRLH